MIVFDLRCKHGHVFEAWFGSSSEYEAQKEGGLLSCPMCDDTDITKAIMAPNVGRKGNQPIVAPPQGLPATAPEAGAMAGPAAASMATGSHAASTDTAQPHGPQPSDERLPVAVPGPSAPKQSPQQMALPAEFAEKLAAATEQLRKVVEDNCDYVGRDFAEEARKIHYGEADERAIYGEATLDDAEELYEEGIDILPVPLRKRDS